MKGCSCDLPRVETYDVEAPRNGLARITRCIECGAHERAWLRPMDPPPTEVPAATPAHVRSAQWQPWPSSPPERGVSR